MSTEQTPIPTKGSIGNTVEPSGYVVSIRAVRRSHDHRGIRVWVPHSDAPIYTHEASSEEQAKELAVESVNMLLRGCGFGMVTVNSVQERYG